MCGLYPVFTKNIPFPVDKTKDGIRTTYVYANRHLFFYHFYEIYALYL